MRYLKAANSSQSARKCKCKCVSLATSHSPLNEKVRHAGQQVLLVKLIKNPSQNTLSRPTLHTSRSSALWTVIEPTLLKREFLRAVFQPYTYSTPVRFPFQSTLSQPHLPKTRQHNQTMQTWRIKVNENKMDQCHISFCRRRYPSISFTLIATWKKKFQK